MGLFGFNSDKNNSSKQADEMQNSGDMMQGNNQKPAVIESSDEKFAEDVIEGSLNAIVLVDFWAPWCQPCKQLGPLLEEKAKKSNGKIRLVKVNIDEHKMVATQLRVQSIPAVFAFFEGRPLDGFAGALSPAQIDQFIERLMKSVGDKLVDPLAAALEQAKECLANKMLPQALELFGGVLQQDPEHLEALAGLAECWLINNDLDKVTGLLNSLSENLSSREEFKAIKAKLEIAQNKPSDAEINKLNEVLKNNPDDLGSLFEIAKAQAAANEEVAAVETLFKIIQKDSNWNDGSAKKLLLSIFDAWGDIDPRTAKARRKLAMLIF